MNQQEFDYEITRLESQWRNAYGQERRLLLWTAFKDANQGDMHDAVSDCIANCRAVPLLDDLSKAVDTAKTRRVSDHYSSGMTYAGGFGGIMKDAARNNKAADPDFVKECIKLYSDYSTRRITYPQFLQGCDLLDSAARHTARQSC